MSGNRVEENKAAPTLARLSTAIALCLFASTSLAKADEYTWRLPHWLAPPAVPADNPMSNAKVELGRRLFFDIRLSGPGYMSCASCHKPERAFTDGRRVAIGITGQRHTRNTPTLANVAYLARFGWAQPKWEPLETQLRRPMFSEQPVEMGTRGHEVHVLGHIKSNSVYTALFQKAFPEDAGDISFETIGRAIASFQRTIVSGNAPFDRFRSGQLNALSTSARRGWGLFKDDRLKCATCHVPPHFTDAASHARDEPPFHNTGLYNSDGRGALPGTDQGLANETGKPDDVGRFRTPTLRNLTVTAPYMHDGSVPTLEDAIGHYAAGGRAAIGGHASPRRTAGVTGFDITENEKRDLIAFLKSLTDEAFLKDPRYRTPFR